MLARPSRDPDPEAAGTAANAEIAARTGLHEGSIRRITLRAGPAAVRPATDSPIALPRGSPPEE